MKKRPPSARRGIQQQYFTPYLSSKRLRCVQSLLSSDASSGKEDAILAVLGIDSRYNEGCRELANFLFFNFYDLRLSGLEESGIPEEDLDDVIILIRPSSVALYCSCVLYDYLLPYIGHWQNLDVYCMAGDTEGAADEDELEEFKIRSFVEMLKGCRSIGIPYYTSRSIHSKLNLDAGLFDKFSVEKWPLIQSYALEGVGGGGFFTMCYEVSSIRDKLLPLYEECDPASVEQMIIRSLPLFERHWREAMNVVSGSSGDVESRVCVAQPDVTENQVLEPIRSYFRHGRLSEHSFAPNANGDGAIETTPFVQFGVRTCDVVPDATTKLAAINNSGVNGRSAMHMIIHSAAPKSPIACTRTYFVNPTSKSAACKRDFSKLVKLYSACVEATKLAIDEFCKTLCVKKAKLSADAVMNKAVVELSHNGAYDFSLQAVDNSGRPLPMHDDVPTFHIKRIQVSVTNVKGTEGGESLGTVTFSETFIESTIFSTGQETAEGALGRSSACLLLSAGVPLHANWQLGQTAEKTPESPIVKLENVLFASESNLAWLCKDSNVDWFDDGSLVIRPLHTTPIRIQPEHVTKLDWSESSQSQSVAALSVQIKPGCVAEMPEFLLENQNFALIFYPSTTALKNFKSKVKPLLERVSEQVGKFSFDANNFNVPSWLYEQHAAAQATLQWHTRSASNTDAQSWSSKLNRAAVSLQPRLSSFMRHFGISSVLNGESVPESDLSLILSSWNENGDAQMPKQADKVCVTVVAGLPGSHADRLSALLVSLHKERVRWVTIKARCLGTDASVLDVEHLQKTLSDVVSKRKASRPGAAATKRLRVVVEVLGFVDVGDVLQTILRHPHPDTRRNMFVGAVTSCVEPASCSLERKRLLPKMAEQCRAGLANCVAFTGSGEDVKDKNLAEIKSLVRSLNPDAAFLLAAEGQTSRSGDFDLILSESAFSAAECVKTRHLSAPGLWKGSFDCGQPHLRFDKITLDFSQPLLRASFSARLRSLRHALAPPPYSSNVYAVHGHVSFTDSPGSDSDVTFVTSTGQMWIEQRNAPSQIKAPAPPPSKKDQNSKPYSLSFYGVDLNEGTLKDWLRKSGRQKPTKKCHKTKATLSKAEIKVIQDEHSTDPLPEGYFFNGTQYCSLMDNSRSYHHPLLDRFIESFLKEENRKIDAFNRKIELESVADLFD